ncbi:MAG TPA: ATP-binding protein [Nevskia sp.]|nr:ATP-binding protein [Nevskia sp.]
MNLFWQITLAEFLLNVAVFAAAIIAYGPLRTAVARLPWQRGWLESAAVGALFGTTTAAALFLPVHFEGGAAAGCQTVLLALAGPLAGETAALAATLTAVLIQLLPWTVGASPALAPVAASLASGAIGLGLRRWLAWRAPRGAAGFGYRHLPLLGALAAAGSLAALWGLAGAAVAANSALPALGTSVGAAVILGTLLLHEQRRHEAERSLRQSQARLAQQASELAAARDAAEAANEQLTSNLAILRTQQEASPDGILVVGTDGEILSYNRRLTEMWNLSQDMLAGGSALRAAEHTLPQVRDPQRNLARWRQIDQQRELKSQDEIELQDGRVMDRHSAPMLRPDGHYLGRVWFYRDISARKHAEARLAVALERAEAASKAKSSFLANMSHELRTPLNAILGYAQLLQRDRSLGERQAAAAATIQHSGEHLLTLITDILDLSKIEAGKLELVTGRADLGAFLQGVADIIRIRAEDKALSFRFEPAPQLPRFARFDEKRLRQVLLNLLGNAVKFTDCGEVTLRAALLHREQDQARLRFEVCDTGTGIAADDLQAIFQPFEQVGDSQRRSGGTGLGLSISRELVRLMGGEIGVDSTPGRGSRFWFEIELPVVEAAAATTAPALPISGYGGPRRRVLVVDDKPANRAVLADMLGLIGFEVQQACDGRDSLERAHETPPDLVLMDIRMPVMDGLEATRRMRQSPVLRTVPIIAVSAGSTGDDAAACRAAGADAFLAKPVRMAPLLDEIGARLRLNWLRDSAPQRSSEAQPAELVLPPAAEMEVLHQLAVAGNMRGVRQHAARISALDPRYRAFSDQLRQLAQAFQSKALLALVERHMQHQEVGS